MIKNLGTKQLCRGSSSTVSQVSVTQTVTSPCEASLNCSAGTPLWALQSSQGYCGHCLLGFPIISVGGRTVSNFTGFQMCDVLILLSTCSSQSTTRVGCCVGVTAMARGPTKGLPRMPGRQDSFLCPGHVQTFPF